MGWRTENDSDSDETATVTVKVNGVEKAYRPEPGDDLKSFVYRITSTEHIKDFKVLVDGESIGEDDDTDLSDISEIEIVKVDVPGNA